MPENRSFLSYLTPGPYKFRYLTISILLWFVLYPFLEGGTIKLVILNTLTSAIVLSGILAVSYGKRTLAIGLAFGLPWFILSWMTIFSPSPSLILIFLSNVFFILFLAFTAIVILSFVLRSTHISGDVLYGAVSIYMMIGGTWSMIYSLLEAVQPGSFAIDAAHNIDGVVNWSDLVYYSYATLTTLGYGDIVPVTPYARSLAVVEAIIGVMYLALIISRLVGLFIGKSLKQ